MPPREVASRRVMQAVPAEKIPASAQAHHASRVPLSGVRSAYMDEPPRVIGPPAAHVVESDLGGTIGLYNPQSEEVLVLNGTASDVWRLSDGTQTLDTMVALLARAYQLRPAEIRDDVAETVQTFWERGLLDVEAT